MRSLAREVLVPASKRLQMNLGVTSREPLNNQPYFHNDVVARQAFAPRAKLVASDEVIARPAARTRSNSEPIASVSVATTRS